MKILFVGVFDREGKSTNTSQILSFKNLGHHVIGYNYRQKAAAVGNESRDKDLISTVKSLNFDLVVYSKCNVVTIQTFEEINKLAKTCLWFMDPLSSYDNEMRTKTALVDYFCCDKENVLKEAKLINYNSFHVCEGFDENVDKPLNVEKEYDISFIGNIYGSRQSIIKKVSHSVKLISNAYGTRHAEEVSRTRINLNICTADGASDRVYKILAAKGFLLTDDWEGREEAFTDGKDLVIYENINDLNEKITYYLENPEEAVKIAESGYDCVQKYSRMEWAKKIIKYAECV